MCNLTLVDSNLCRGLLPKRPMVVASPGSEELAKPLGEKVMGWVVE